MPLQLTSSYSSRVRKSQPSTATSRQSSAPYANYRRTKAIPRTKSAPQEAHDDSDAPDARLDATGHVLPSVRHAHVQDVLGAMDHTTRTMFCDMPERAGMNSTRIAEVLNFQQSLPPVVSLAHIHAVMSASSKTEREIATLLAAHRVRKLTFAGRGHDLSGLSEVLIGRDGLQALLGSSSLPSDVVAAFVKVLERHPRAVCVHSRSLAPTHVQALTAAGFLVSASIHGSSVSHTGASIVATPSISRAASGTSAAVGGDAAFERLGGIGGPRRASHQPEAVPGSNEMHLSVPNIGPYLRLLHAGRSHLVELLGKCPYREAPLDLLRARWDGAVDSGSRASTAQRVRGDFSSVMPAKTKKWRDLRGLNFDWALEECLGAGLIELFETHSVGLGVRALT